MVLWLKNKTVWDLSARLRRVQGWVRLQASYLRACLSYTGKRQPLLVAVVMSFGNIPSSLLQQRDLGLK